MSDSVDESYSVYSAILKKITGNPVLFVISRRTGGITFERPGDTILGHPVSQPFRDAFSDYAIKSKKVIDLTNSFGLKTRCELIERADFDTFFKSNNLKEDWKNFYRRYPGSPGFVIFSRVGFDPAKKHAIVYRDIFCGDLCSDGSFVFLENTEGEWEIVKTILIRAS